MDPFLTESSTLSGNSQLRPTQRNRNASPIPMILGFFALVLSLLFLRVAETNSYLDSDFHDIVLRVTVYLLSPFAVVTFMILDIVLQGRGLENPAFFTRPMYSLILRLLVVASFAIAAFDIYTIAKVLADVLTS